MRQMPFEDLMAAIERAKMLARSGHWREPFEVRSFGPFSFDETPSPVSHYVPIDWTPTNAIEATGHPVTSYRGWLAHGYDSVDAIDLLPAGTRIVVQDCGTLGLMLDTRDGHLWVVIPRRTL